MVKLEGWLSGIHLLFKDIGFVTVVSEYSQTLKLRRVIVKQGRIQDVREGVGPGQVDKLSGVWEALKFVKMTVHSSVPVLEYYIFSLAK